MIENDGQRRERRGKYPSTRRKRRREGKGKGEIDNS
jgi:hypothetical protein